MMTIRESLTHAYLRYVASTSRPVALGPFRSELGFEVLYWLPFLEKVVSTYKIAPERCLAISRGGMGQLYPATRNVDLYQAKGIDAVRLENQIDWESKKIQKQHRMTAWDRQIVKESAAAAYGPSEKVHVIHPSLMYGLFDDFWEERRTAQFLQRWTAYGPLKVPNLPESVTLPDQFIAMKFYERVTFPFNPQVLSVMQAVTAGCAEAMPVVWLDSPYFTDDHVDAKLDVPGVIHLPAVAPEQHLLLTAAVLARSQAFVGTYGGVAQWALRYGKTSLSFFAEFGGTALAHRMLSHRLSALQRVPFEVCDLKGLRLWEVSLHHIREIVKSSSGATVPTV